MLTVLLSLSACFFEAGSLSECGACILPGLGPQGPPVCLPHLWDACQCCLACCLSAEILIPFLMIPEQTLLANASFLQLHILTTFKT